MVVVDSSPHKMPRGMLLRWALWFLVLNSALLMLVSLNYLKSMALPEAVIANVFLVVAYIGHFISLSLYLFPIIALIIIVYPERRLLVTSSICLETLLLLTIIIDSLVFAQYRFHLNGMVWNLITSGAAKDILPLTNTLWLILAILISVIVLIEWQLSRFCWYWVKKEKKYYGAVLTVFIVPVIIAGHGMHSWADANHYTPITKLVRYLPAYKPLTMKKLLVKLGLADKDANDKMLKTGGDSALHYPLEPIHCKNNLSKKMNILLIVIDSWRFDAISPVISPNIWNLSKESWRFDNHFSSGNATRFGIFGMFYGIYGTYWHSMLAEEKSPVLMKELVKQQYQMEILASAPLINPEFDRTVFSDIRDKIELRQPGNGSVENDRIITTKMINFLKSAPRTKPFLGFMFYDSPHVARHPDNIAPFQPAIKDVNHLTLNNNTDPVPYLNTYKNAVYYNDLLIGEVLDQLRKSQLQENTIVMITGDHGEEFNDLKKNYWGHVGNFSKFQTQTPLVVYWPGNAPAIFNHTTSHLDIAPTLMKEVLGCDTEISKYSNGRDLRDKTARPYVMISSWDTFSTNEPDRITVAQKSGEVDILDASYNPIPGAKIRPEISKSAMEGMGRFFAR